jgi:hypothetical protein
VIIPLDRFDEAGRGIGKHKEHCLEEADGRERGASSAKAFAIRSAAEAAFRPIRTSFDEMEEPTE